MLYIRFISQYHYKIQSRPIPFAIDFIPFIFHQVFKTSHTQNHLLTNSVLYFWKVIYKKWLLFILLF